MLCPRRSRSCWPLLGLQRAWLSSPRFLYGTRLSLLLAPAAALLSLLLASVIGAAAGYLGGWWDRLATRAIDLTLSLPWLFLLITARALLPLNVSPLASLLITFTLL